MKMMTEKTALSAVAVCMGAPILALGVTAAPPARADDDVNRVISSRGEVVCLMFQTQGLNQTTLDQVAQYVLTTPAIKLSKQQAIQVIQGSVEADCPQYSQQIARAFG
jgi:hypothetical protein